MPIRRFVEAVTPSGPLTKRRAKSSTDSALSASPIKSACPGVSIRVILMSSPQLFSSLSLSISQSACFDRIVTPLFFSRLSVSRKASPLSTLPAFLIIPRLYKMLSVSVVFPASTWARIPIVIFFKPLI